MDCFPNPVKPLEHYNVHILVFLLAFFVTLTIAHPAFFINDEWITANQLTQLNNGHQLILNEGKYGSFENGTPYKYFETHQNSLGYTLFLPVASLPAEWLVYHMGDNFVFFIVYLGIFLLIVIYLLINSYFSEYAKIGKWWWTDGFLILAFILFFVNLYFYIPFSITGTNGRPEVEAIVFTNCLLLSILAVITYDVIRQIFKDSLYSFFGVIICFTSSSYLFWSSFCKDHVLVACVFAAVILMVVRFWKTHDIRYLFAAFSFSGLLAWARPELALFVCASLCVFVLYQLISNDTNACEKNRISILISPLFTIPGAIPLMLNNYLITGNPLRLPWSVWETPSAGVGATGTVTTVTTTSDALQTFLQYIHSATTLPMTTLQQDLFGILVFPQSGSLGVFPIVPLFFVALFLIPVMIVLQKIRFDTKEKQVLGIMGLLSIGVFFAYIRCIDIMNVDSGIAPDIRYLSPLYLPLNIIGLVILQKTKTLSGKTFSALQGMVAVWLVAIPFTLIIMSRFYPIADDWADLFPPLAGWVSISVFVLVSLVVISYLGSIYLRTSQGVTFIFLILLISVPFIWQIDATFLTRLNGAGLGGYSFWMPAVRFFFNGIF